jgi:hypothetical protein
MSIGKQATEAIQDTTSPIVVHSGENQNQPELNPPFARLNAKQEGIGVKELRDKANLKDKPTTADAKKGTKDLPSAMSQVGNGASFLQNMYPMMSMVSAIANGGSQSSRKRVIEDSLSGALAILVNKYDYDLVVSAFDAALANDGIKLIDEVYRDVIKNALTNLFKSAVQFGPNNVPVYSYSTVTTIGPVPSPLVTEVPDLYLQEYYIQAEDPYPGYIKWNSQDSSDYVFTERTIGDKYYVSPQEEVYSISEQELADALDPYVRDQNLTAQILNNLMREQDSTVEANTNETTMGKGTGSGGANSLRLVLSLLGYISVISNFQKTAQLPFSVLNTGSIVSSLTKHERRMAELKRMKGMLKTAATPLQTASLLSSALGGLGGLAGVGGAIGILTNVSNVVQNISSLTGLSNITNITTSIPNIASVTASISTSTGKVNVSVRVPSILTL